MFTSYAVRHIDPTHQTRTNRATDSTSTRSALSRAKGKPLMRRLFAASLLTLMLSAPLVTIPRGDSMAQVSGSGLPLPRFVSLRAGEVNLRTGPGVQYPVEWVYRKSGLPLEVIAEYKAWRKVRDWQGSQGWVHQTMLSSKRSFIVTGISRDLRAKPSQKSALVAQVQSNVSGSLLACPSANTKVTLRTLFSSRSFFVSRRLKVETSTPITSSAIVAKWSRSRPNPQPMSINRHTYVGCRILSRVLRTIFR